MLNKAFIISLLICSISILIKNDTASINLSSLKYDNYHANTINNQKSALNEASQKPSTNTVQKLNKTRLPFIKNDGQINSEVKFYANTFGGTVYVTGKELVYNLPLREGEKKDSKILNSNQVDKKNISTKGIALREKFVNSQLNKTGKFTPKGGEKSEAVFSSFLGDDQSKWKSGVSTYDSVKVGEPWQGIELELNAYGNNVEKIFTVSPRTNPQKIALAFEGAQDLRVDENTGELVVNTELGDVKFTKPIAYQFKNGKKEDVEVAYVSNDGVYGFEVGNYNQQAPLIIDPLLASTFIGGSGSSFGGIGNVIAIDSSGNVFVAGITQSNVYPTTAGAYDQTYDGSDDVFVSKLNSTLTALSASTYIGGVNGEFNVAMKIDSSGNVVIAGSTQGGGFPSTVGSYDAVHNGSYDVFVSKFNTSLTTLVASTFIGGVSDDFAADLAIDSSGNIFVTGSTRGPTYPATAGVYDLTYNDAANGYDAFVSKLNSTLTTLSASTYIGGSEDEYPRGIAIDSSSNIFIAGLTSGAGYPTTVGAYDQTYNGSNDVFISKFNSSLTALSSSTFIGGTNSDNMPSPGNGLALDSSGNVFVLGVTSGADYPTTAGVYDQSYNGGGDLFISKFNNTLTSLSASSFLGGTSSDNGYGIAINSSGNIFVTGFTSGADYPTTAGAYDEIYNGSDDTFISKLNSTLTSLSASTFIGGTNSDIGNDLTFDSSGNVFLSGETGSANYPTTAGAYDETHSGSLANDVFVSKLDTALSGPPDTTPPAAPGTPDMTAATDTGSSNTDNITSDTTPDFTISCETGATVSLLESATVLGTGTCAASTVTITSSALGNGAHTITARQTDLAGNVSSTSSGLAVTIDSSDVFCSIPVGTTPYHSTLVGTKLYVNNADTNTVSVIDTGTNTVTATITVDPGPYSSTLVGTRLYVNNSNFNTVSVIDTGTNTVIATIPVGSAPYYSTLVGTKVYVNDRFSGTVSVIDTVTNTVTATITVGSSPYSSTLAGTKLYVNNSNTNTVSVIDTVSNTVTSTITVGNFPYFSTLAGTRLYVNNASSNTVSVIDTGTNAVISTITVGSLPYISILVGTKLYVSNSSSGTVSVIDTGTNAVIATITVGSFPYFSTLVGTKLYLSSYGLAGTVSVIDTSTNTVITTITVESRQVSSTLVGTKLYVNNADTNTVSVIDTATDTVTCSESGTPAAPGTPDMTAATDSGSSNTDNITSDSTPDFTISCETGATVSLLESATVLGTGTCAASTVTITSSALGAGAHTITARQTDTAGNVSSTSSGLSVTIDATAPAAPGTPDMTAATDSGSSNTDNITSDSTPDFTISCETGSTVSLLESATVLGSGTCAASTVTITSSALGAGAHTITARQTDTAGNVSSTSSGLSVTIDASAPAAPGTPDMTAATDTGSSNTDNITSDTTPNFTISCETGATVSLLESATVLGTGTCAASTVTITSSALGAGIHTITARQTDPAGNVSLTSSGLSVTIDTSAPAAPGTPDLQAASDTGASSTDNITHDTTPTFDITCAVGNTVRLKRGGVTVGTASCAASPVSITSSTLSSGVHSITATQVDSAGNESAASSALSITIDTSDCIIPVGDLPYESSLVGTKLYVNNLLSDNVSVINTATNTVITTIPVGSRPYFSTRVGTKVYVSNSVSASVSVIDTATDTVIATIPVGTNPYYSTLVGTKLYVNNVGSANVSVIDTGTNTVIATIPADVGPYYSTLAGASLYVNNADSTTVTVINTNTNTVTATITVGTNPRYSYLVGTSLFVSNLGSANVSVINTATNTVVDTITVGDGPYLATLVGTTLYVNNSGSASVSAIDTGTRTVIATIPVGSMPFSSALAGTKLYVINNGSDDVSVINTATNTVVAVIPVGDKPYYSTLAGTNLYVTNTNSDNVTVIDTTTDTVVCDNSPNAPGTPDLQAASDTGSSSADNVTSDNTPTFDITCDVGYTVQLKEGLTVLGSILCSASPVSITSSSLTSGVHSITATQVDGGGNESDASTALSITIDASTPSAPGTPDLTAATDTGSSNTDNITSDTTPDFTISCETGATVSLLESATVLGSGTCAASTVTITSSALGAGAHTITARQTDLAGNVSLTSSGLSVTIDAATPAAPGTPDMTAATDSGSSNTDNITSDTTPDFTISCETGATVSLLESATVLGTGTCAASTVTITSSALGAGAHTITARQTDAAGNVSLTSSGLSVTIDATAPAVPGTPDLTSASDTGSSNTDNLTSDTTPSFTISCETGATVSLLESATVLGTGTCAASTVTITSSALGAGAHTITARQTDTAGNVSSTSSGLSITIDSSTPTAPNTAPDMSSGTDTGTSNTDNITSDATPDFTGPCTIGEIVTLYVDGVASSSLTCSTGSFTLTPPALTNGSHSITYTYMDLAGNESNQSPNLTVVIDTSSPAAPVISSPTNGSTVGTTTPVISGTAENNSTVSVYIDSILVGTVTANGSGAWSYTVTAALSEAVHTVQATATDTAGNISPGSSIISFTVTGDADGDGIGNTTECSGVIGPACVDTDGDGTPDYLDTDSDNDGDGDQVEDTTDTDGDGIPDRLEPDDRDTDGDGIVDELDPDSDGDGSNDGVECPVVTNCPDADGDLIPDYLDPDSDGSPVGGGDSDGDGIVDDVECPDGIPCPDTDGDTVPNYTDEDSDNDGIPDDVECPDGDPCPDTDGDGTPNYLDPDSDDDGISDRDECINGPPCPDGDDDGDEDYIDPDTIGDVLPISPTFVKWNTFLNQWNFLELSADGTGALSIQIKLYNSSGTLMLTRSVTIQGNNQIDIDVHNLVKTACETENPSSCAGLSDLDGNGIVDGYGLIGMIYTGTPRLVGRLTNYKKDSGSDTFSFAFARELRSSSTRNTYAVANTFDPQSQGYIVPNFGELIHLGDSDDAIAGNPVPNGGYTVNIYDIAGTLKQTRHIVLRALQEYDFATGHEFLDSNGRVIQSVYLIEIVPDDLNSEYVFSVARYSSNSLPGQPSDLYNYAMAVPSRRGTADPLYATISNQVMSCGSVTNWVEVGNVTSTPVFVTVKFRNSSGQTVSTSTDRIDAKSQYHYNASSQLALGGTGSVEITSTTIDSIIAQSMVYVHECDANKIQTAYVSVARKQGRAAQVGTLNTFIGMTNTIKVVSAMGATQTYNANAVTYDGSNYSLDLSLVARATDSMDAATDVGFPSNKYGKLTITTDEPGTVVAEVLRVRPVVVSGKTRWDFAIPTEIK